MYHKKYNNFYDILDKCRCPNFACEKTFWISSRKIIVLITLKKDLKNSFTHIST